jgi:hypothetical protein
MFSETLFFFRLIMEPLLSPGFFNNTVATCPSCACGCNATLGSNVSSCPATWQSGPNAATQLVLGPAVRTTAPLATNSKVRSQRLEVKAAL